MKTIHVIYRACDRVAAVHSQPRPFGLAKGDLIRRCFRSLKASLAGSPHTLTVVGDRLSAGLTQFLEAEGATVVHGEFGNDGSIRRSLELALALPENDDWVYFCEDDYFHLPGTFPAIQAVLDSPPDRFSVPVPSGLLRRRRTMTHPGLVIFPSDYPDRYQPGDRSPGHLFVTGDRHWRQVYNITFTFLMSRREVGRNAPVLRAAASGANDAYLSDTLFRPAGRPGKLLCLSPVPSLAAHLHTFTLPPLIDWERVVMAD